MDNEAGRDDVRIGTQEREQAFGALRGHLDDGRLDIHEYDDRAAKLVAAKTRNEIRELFADLPPPYPAFLAPPPPPMAPPPPAYPQGYAMPPQLAYQYSDKSRVAAGLLQILLPFGVGRFYTGHTGIAVAQLLTVCIGVGAIWSMVDGIILLANGGTDPYGRPLRP